jgi:hypothetical protein
MLANFERSRPTRSVTRSAAGVTLPGLNGGRRSRSSWTSPRRRCDCAVALTSQTRSRQIGCPERGRARANSGLRDKVLALHEALFLDNIPHAFGGATLGFAIPAPRSILTWRSFLPIEDADTVLPTLWRLGLNYYPGHTREDIDLKGQVRLSWDNTAVYLFFPVHDFYATVAARVVHPVGDDRATVPVITREDIAIFKTLFNRPKDWVDIESLLLVQGRSFDITYVTNWLTELLGDDDSRIDRMRKLHATTLSREG